MAGWGLCHRNGTPTERKGLLQRRFSLAVRAAKVWLRALQASEGSEVEGEVLAEDADRATSTNPSTGA